MLKTIYVSHNYCDFLFFHRTAGQTICSEDASATFVVVKNSHVAITAGEGEFKLPNLLSGTYTITAWHESYGEQTQEVTINDQRQRIKGREFRFQGEAVLRLSRK